MEPTWGWKNDSATKVLTMKSGGQDSRPQNPCKEILIWEWTLVISMLGRQREGSPGSLAVYLAKLVSSRPVRDSVSQNPRWTTPEAQRPGLTSGLHTYMHKFTCTLCPQRHTCTHKHTYTYQNKKKTTLKYLWNWKEFSDSWTTKKYIYIKNKMF